MRIEAGILTVAMLASLAAADGEAAQTGERADHETSTRGREAITKDIETPPLPQGMSLDAVLDHAARTPPDDRLNPLDDDAIYAFALFEKFEYRVSDDSGPDHLGWEAQGWVGRDLDKFWWEHEAEAVFDGPDHGESETNLLYARLISPFWNLRGGLRYANAWHEGEDYDDRWAGIVSLQGMSPYMFEVDSALVLDEDGHLSAHFEAEYDLRITQRLVLQPLVATAIYAQDIDERGIGAGISSLHADLRLRYEFSRKCAPYIGGRYAGDIGETRSRTEDAGGDPDRFFLLVGLRFAF